MEACMEAAIELPAALFEIGDVLVEQWLNLRWLNIRMGRHETKERQQKRRSRNDSNGSLHAFFAGNALETKNQEKRRAYVSAFSSKIWLSRVICVFLLCGLT